MSSSHAPAALASTLLALLPGALHAAATAAQSPYTYRQPTDAERYADQMMNDVRAGLFRNDAMLGGALPPNPFTARIEEYEAEERARWAAIEAFEESERQRRADEAHWDELFRLEDERRLEHARQIESTGSYFRSLGELASQGSARAYMEQASMIESGRIRPKDFDFPYPEHEWRARLYEAAYALGEELAYVGRLCAVRREIPDLTQMLGELRSESDPFARHAYLWKRCYADQVGARLLLAGWYGQRFDELGPPPPPFSDKPTARASALLLLEQAYEIGRDSVGAWYGRELLAPGATEHERAMGIDALQRATAIGYTKDPSASLELARHLMGQARTQADFERPREILAQLAAVPVVAAARELHLLHLLARDGRFAPKAAADAYATLAGLAGHAREACERSTALGQASWFGTGLPQDRLAARRAFEEACRLGGPSAEQGEAGLWRAAALVESALARGPAGAAPSPAEREAALVLLRTEAERGSRLARLLATDVTLGNPRASQEEARAAFDALVASGVASFVERPAEALLLFECVVRAAERGLRADLGAPALEIARLERRDEVSAGTVLRAQLALSALSARDVRDRSGLAALVGELQTAAEREPRAWPRLAALLEVLNVDPIPSRTWNERWLASWRLDGRNVDATRRAWAEALAEPDDARLEALSAADAFAPDVRALLASLRLRGTGSREAAESSVAELIDLAGAGAWHAEALLQDFEARYRSAYVRRTDLAGWRRDRARVAESMARWRERGHAHLPADAEARWTWVGRALAAGSSAFARADLQAAAHAGSAAAHVAELVLASIDADPRTPEERIDDELAESLLAADPRAGWGSTVETIGYVTDKMLAAGGTEASRERANGYARRQAGRHPHLAWGIIQARRNGIAGFEADRNEAFRMMRSAFDDPRTRRTWRRTWEYADLASQLGEVQDFVRLAREFGEPYVAPGVLLDHASHRHLGVVAWDLAARALRVEWGVASGEDPLPAGFVPEPASFARLERFLFHALGVGDGKALARLCAPPFDGDPARAERIATTLLGLSTLNARLALPLLERARAAGSATAARELAPWLGPDGAPTARLAFVDEARVELRLDAETPAVDPRRWDDRIALDKRVDFAWLPLEAAHLRRVMDAAGVDPSDAGDTPPDEAARAERQRVARARAASARAVLLAAGLAFEPLLAANAVDWEGEVDRALAAGDVARLWAAVPEAEWAFRERRLFFLAPDVTDGNRTQAATRIGAIALRLLREARLPPGRARAELVPLLEIGFVGGDGESLEGLVTLARETASDASAGDAAVLALVRRALEQDVANALFLERRVRKHCHDESGWNAAFRAHGLHADERGTPTPLLVFLREALIREHDSLRVSGLVTATLPFFPRNADCLLGKAGSLVEFRAAVDSDPLALAALAALGFGPRDGDEFRRP